MAPPFQYEAPAPNPYGLSIGEILLHRGDVAAHAAEIIGQAHARAAEQSGAAWAGAASDIGHSVSGAIERANDPQRKLQAIELAKAQQGQADLEALDAAWQKPGGRQAIVDALPGHLKGAVMTQFEQHDKLHAEAQEAQGKADALSTEAFADTAAGIKAHDYEPGAAQMAISDLKQKYANDPTKLQMLQRAEAAIQANPTVETVKAIADPLIAASPKRTELEQAHQKILIDEAAKAETVRHNQENERIRGLTVGREEAAQAETARHNLELEKASAANVTREQAAQAEAARHNRATEAHASATDDAAPALTPDAIKLTARQFAMTGQLPPMGMGKQGAKVRTDIINAAAEEYKNLDLPAQVAAYKANQGSLTKLQQQRDAIGSFETTAKKNIDLFLETAGKVVDTGSPLLNTPLRMVSGKLLGSPDQAAFDAARQVAVNEIAKITSNPTLAGTLSDSARHEIEAFNPQNATLKQSVAVMRLLRQDMGNRTSSLDDQIKAIQQRIATKPGASAEPIKVGGFSVVVK